MHVQPVLKSSILVHYVVMSYPPLDSAYHHISTVLLSCEYYYSVYADTVYHHSTVVQLEMELHNARFFFALCCFSLHSIHRLVTDRLFINLYSWS